MTVRFAAPRARTLALVSAALMLSTAPALAGSTGDETVEMVVVTGQRTSPSGLSADLRVPKERSVITGKFLDTQAAGQTVFQSLNMVPGLNFTNSDPYGSSGGNIRLHGMDGARISFIWDGMPLNDTGNFALYTNQTPDAEIVDSITVNQGTTDVDTPTASAVGGVISVKTARRNEQMGALADFSVGSFDQKRIFLRLDSGAFGPWDTRAFVSGSYQDYDKFKGPGHEQKKQINGYVFQDLGDLGFVTLGAHFNQNRNNFYFAPSFLNIATDRLITAAHPSPPNVNPLAVGNPNIAVDNVGGYTGVLPGVGSPNPDPHGFGWDYDDVPTCTRPVSEPQNEATAPGGTTAVCTDFYRLRINPSDTGNVRMSSLFHLTDSLSFTVDPSFQYVLANGGGVTVIRESDPRLIGASKATGASLNGDGDLNDAIQLYTPNTTNTRRWGLNSSMIWAPDNDNVFQVAYALDWGLVRQTGNYATFSATNGPYDPFAGLKDTTHRVIGADGTPLRGRDRKSYAITNQVSAAYEGRFLDDMLAVSLGLRMPFMERDLNQYCYIQAAGAFSQITPGIGYQYCTSEPSSALAADGTVTFAGVAGARFTPPGTATVNYSRLLPNAGLSVQPWGDAHQFFAAYATELSAPRTDNLYNGGVENKGLPNQKFLTFASVEPETSGSYSLGYRFHGEWLQGSITLWNTQFKNRIVSTFDPSQGISIDHNIGSVNMDGVDVEASANPTDDLSLYTTVSYLHSRVVNDLALGGAAPGAKVPAPFYVSDGTIYAPTAGKEFLETPDWMTALRAQYTFDSLRFGLDGKFVGRRFATEDNDYRLPGYATANIDVTYEFQEIGWAGTYLKLNVMNVFDTKYFSSVQTSRSCFTPRAPTVAGCTSYPALVLSAPRTLELTFRVAY
jgi:iron complex outermembrane receptor protein